MSTWSRTITSEEATVSTEANEKLQEALSEVGGLIVRGLNAFFAALADSLRPDPFARSSDPVRHPEGREDPSEYA